MKKALGFILMLAVLLCSIPACKKGTESLTNAIITGSDARMCACCGGFMITFNGETKPYTGDFKLIDNGAEVGLKETDSFPLYVKVAWRENTAGICNHIIITKLQRR